MAWADELATKMGATLSAPLTASTYLKMTDGRGLYNSFGGGASQVRIASYESIVNACSGHNQYFPTNYAANIQFATINAIDGHTSTNACVELRHAFMQVLRSNGSWEFAYHTAPMYGKRLPNGDLNYNIVPGTQTQLPGGILRIQPGPAIAGPAGETNSGIWGYEVWPSDWDGSGNAVPFWGKVDKTLYQDGQCFVMGLQARLALWNESGVDDRASSFFVIQTGCDFYSSPNPGYRYITDAGVTTSTYGAGYPYGAFDGSFGPWQRIVPGDWQWFVCVTVTDLAAVASGTPPPWGSWSTPWPYVTSGDESITEAQFSANPPPAPPGTIDPEEPPPSPRLPLPSTGRWFPKLTSSENTWASKSFSTTPSNKVRRRRGLKFLS